MPNDTDGSPPAKRQRVLSKACEYCKAKKLRCDSQRPCESCSRKGTECVYKEKGQPGLRPGYGKDVERRLTALEEGYHRMDTRMDEMLRQSQVFALGQQAIQQHGLPHPNVHPHGTHSYDTQVGPGAPAALTQPGMEMPQLLPTPGDTASLSATAADVIAPAIVPGSLPPPEIMLNLADLYFDLVHPWAPLFHRANFTSNLLTPDREVLQHGLVVIAFPFWTKPMPSLETRNMYVDSSRKHIMLYCTDNCSVTAAQALALLAIDALGQGHGTRIWNIMSMLNASVQQLGLTREPLSEHSDPATPMVGNDDPEQPWDASAAAAEERRRLFWTIFSIDRFGSIALGQAGGIPVNRIKLRHPTSDEDWARGGLGPWFEPTEPVKLGPNSQSWNSYIELLTLLDRENRLLIRPFDFSLRAHREEWQCGFRMLDVTLNTWLETAPAQCRDPFQTFDPMWVMVRATFELIKLRLYTVAGFPSGNSSELPPSASARTRCREAVKTVTLLATGLKPEELARLGPPFAFVVWVAARSLVILWTSGYESSNPQQAVPPDLDGLMDVLYGMSARWPCAARHAEIIKLILDTRDEPGGSNYLKIFNDTRRTSYGLQALLNPALRQQAHELEMIDFFSMAFPDQIEMNPFAEPMGQSAMQDWLA